MTENTRSDDRPVCPRCGNAADDLVFCRGCGVNLRQQGELPTAEAYAAAQRERGWLEEQEREREEAPREAQQTSERLEAARPGPPGRAEPTAAPEPSPAPTRRARKSIIAVIGIVVLAGTIGAAFALTGGDDREQATSVATAQPSPATSPAPATGVADSDIYFTDDGGEARSEPDELVFGKSRVADIAWTGWGDEQARGSGRYEANECNPSCADGSIVTADATIELSGVRTCEDKRQYTTGSLTTTDSSGATFTDDNIVSSDPECAAAEPTDPSASTPTPETTPATSAATTGRRCGELQDPTPLVVKANENASCGFAMNVAQEALAQLQTATGGFVVTAHSPATDADVRMSCESTEGAVAECRGGNGVVVWLHDE